MQLWISVVAALATSGCASTIGIIHASTGEWPTSSSFDQRAWLDGEPTRALRVNAKLTSPLRAECVERVHEPASKVTTWTAGLDAGGRLAIGFIGLSELALAAVIGLLPPAEDHNVGTIVGTSFLALDGLASVILAFAIPDTEKTEHRFEDARDYDVFACPPDVAFEVEGNVFTVEPDGTLPGPANRVLVEAVVARNAPIALRFRDSVTTTFVPPEIRCIWGYDNLITVADLNCPPRALLEPALPR